MTLYASPFLIVLPIILPLAAGLLSFLCRRFGSAISLLAALANGAAVFLLFEQFNNTGPLRYDIGGWSAPLGIVLRTDGPALLLLAMTAVSGLSVTVYARGYFSFRIAVPQRLGRHEQQERFFHPLWMLLLGGLNGLFLSGDIFNLYVTLEIIGIAAVALASLSGKPASQIASFRYLLVSLLGSLSYLLGVTLLYRIYGVLDLAHLSRVSSPSLASSVALSLISIGLMLKTALFPMHFWLPPAHANALAPVSAILSGLVIKGSFSLLFRLWFEIFPTLVTDNAKSAIGLLGSAAILWGGMQAMRQKRLKLLIAYSTVSQIGYLFVAFPLVGSDLTAGFWNAVIFMALAHSFAKCAMFMSAGAIFLTLGHDRIDELAGVRALLPVTVFAFALAGVNIMGLPPSGGFIAKWLLITSSFSLHRPLWGVIILLGSLMGAAYVFRVVSRFFVVPENVMPKKVPRQLLLLEWPALTMAVFSFLFGLLATDTLSFLHHATANIFSCSGVLP